MAAKTTPTLPVTANRLCVQGAIPLLSVEGKVSDCGELLGHAWRDALVLQAQKKKQDSKPWWQEKHYQPLIDRYAPHLPDLYQGMAKGAGVLDRVIGSRGFSDTGGCTSMALHPSVTLDKHPIAAQSKDVPSRRWYQFVVLRAKFTDSPKSMLTLTYPGWIFGHGFVRSGCTIYRNMLFADNSSTRGRMTYGAWGTIALHCHAVQEVKEMTLRYGGVSESFHVAVADESGGILGLENAQGHLGWLKACNGIYTHANAVTTPSLKRYEHDNIENYLDDSDARERSLYNRLSADHGRLTAQLVYAAMMSHDKFPNSVCRHQHLDALTAGIVISEPTAGLIHVTRGNPCMNWPTTYSL